MELSPGTEAWKSIGHDSISGWCPLRWADIGSAAINRSQQGWGEHTHIDKNNPYYGDNGVINHVSLHVAQTTGTAWKIGTFYVVSGNSLKCRDAENIGALSPGINEKTVSLNVHNGDYIGEYGGDQDNKIDVDFAGTGYWYASHDGCVTNDQYSYTSLENRTMSVYGTA